MKEYKIPLLGGGYTLVDKEDYNRFCHLSFYLSGQQRPATFIKTQRKSKIWYLHRMIMNDPKGKLVDHINGNLLDNRRINLRICTNAENTRNKKLSKNNTSGYKGVHFHKKGNYWSARIKINGKSIWGGSFKTKEKAAMRYNELALQHHGEFARLNVIK